MFYLMVSGSCLAGTAVGTLKLSVGTKIAIAEQRGSAGAKLYVGQVRTTDKDTNHIGVLERKDVLKPFLSLHRINTNEKSLEE